MSTLTPETNPIITEMETPQILSPEEIERDRSSYDLPDANHEEFASNTFADLDAEVDGDSIDEEDSQSEIPGDPRGPHQTQPPTSEEY